MARHTESMSVVFNDNDGGVSWSCNPDTASDVFRHHELFGKWRARWIFLKRFWIAMKRMESIAYYEEHSAKVKRIKLWKFTPEIPE